MRGQSSYLKTIERRIAYLQDKLLHVQLKEARVHWVRAEIAALTWALPILQCKVDCDKIEKGNL